MTTLLLLHCLASGNTGSAEPSWVLRALGSLLTKHLSMLLKSKEGLTGFSVTSAFAFLEQGWSIQLLIASSPL